MSANASPAAGKTRSILAPFVFAAPVLAVLVGLGVWQVERLAWKEGVLAEIAARVHAPPAPLAPSSQWTALAASDYDYTRVAVTGRFEPRREALIFRASGKVEGALEQPGYWVMAPLRLPDGASLLVNRGFVAAGRKDDPALLDSLPGGEVTLTGLLRMPETRNPFTPADDPARGVWYTRDPVAIATALNLERAAPFSLDEDPHAAGAGLPAGGATVFDIPNNHLSYAVTWFGLAATLIGVLGVFTWRRLAGD